MLQSFGIIGEAESPATAGQSEASQPSAVVKSSPQPGKSTPRESNASLVPVSHLTSTREEVTVEELSRLRNLAVSGESGQAAEDLGVSGARRFDTAGEIVDHISRTPGAVGLVPWDEVDTRVKALDVEGTSLFGPNAGNYPRELRGGTAPEPGGMRKVVVAGDVTLDRGLPYVVFHRGLGLDFPLQGGYAAVTWRSPAPSEYSEFGVIHDFRAERRGGSGAVREYVNGADLALANLENPVLANATYHREGTVFTGDPRLLPVLQNAGIDGVTLANNHVMDARAPGLAETLRQLDGVGMPHAGAGMDLAAAREPMVFDLGGLKVGVLSYQGVPENEWAWATPERPGTAPLQTSVMKKDVRALKSEVDLVFVMPHWGMEYTATPEKEQIDLARAAVEAGADAVIGGHAHWPKGMEIHQGRPVFYGTGNFLLDQTWSEETSTGIFAEITLYRDRVVQARPVPFVILDYAQPNFLLPEAGGNRALKRVYAASLGPEFTGGE